MRKSTPTLVKMMNRELIINELRRNPEQSRADLSKKTELSKPAVSDIVQELIDEGIILEIGLGPSTGGKKPIHLIYNAHYSYVIGTLIENDTIFFALGDMNGDIVNVIEKQFRPRTKAQMIIDLIVTGVTKLLDSENITPEKVLGIVLGVSGIKMDSEEIIQSSPTINWGNINLGKELSSKLNKEVIIENDVNLMTIGEHYKGQAKDIEDFVYLFIGNGIGSGLFLNGEFYKGFHSASGEIGFMIVGTEQKMKQDSGVFETNYGLFGISERLREQSIQLDHEKNKSLLEILQSKRHDQGINKILVDVIDHWSKATINMISMIDPQAVIVSGELEEMDDISFNQYVNTIEKYVPKMPEVKVTKLGFKAGIYGAFHLALDYFHIAGFKHNKK